MNNYPRISVIIVTKNRCRFLKRTLDKLFEDDYPNKEIIVIDGASTDGTIELLKSYGGKIANWVSEPDQGQYDALNKGLPLATGEIIKIINDDDVARPSSFINAATYLAAHPEIDVVFGQTYFWDTRGKEPIMVDGAPRMDPRILTTRNWIRRSLEVPADIASFSRKSVFDKTGPFSNQYLLGDVEFWARAAHLGINMALVPEYFLDYYITGENAIGRIKRKDLWVYVDIARYYGDWTDVLYNLITKLDWGIVRRVFNSLGIHPARWWKMKNQYRTGIQSTQLKE